MVRKYLPKFHSNLHYRLLDVSSFKTTMKDWCNIQPFDKDNLPNLNKYYCADHEMPIDRIDPHDALFDIKASIAELKYYQKFITDK